MRWVNIVAFDIADAALPQLFRWRIAGVDLCDIRGCAVHQHLAVSVQHFVNALGLGIVMRFQTILADDGAALWKLIPAWREVAKVE